MDGGYYLRDPTKCPNGFQFEPPAPGLFGQVNNCKTKLDLIQNDSREKMLGLKLT